MTIFTCDLELNYRHTQLKWDKNETKIGCSENTHPEQWAVIYAAAVGEQLGVRCLAQEHLGRGIEVERERCTFTPPTESCGISFFLANLIVTVSESHIIYLKY